MAPEAKRMLKLIGMTIVGCTIGGTIACAVIYYMIV